MPLITGPIGNHGAVIDVMVGVRRSRQRLLAKHQLPIPDPVHVRALLDTGASLSGFHPRVFSGLDLTPTGRIAVLTTSTPIDVPFESDVYWVSLSLVANGQLHPFPDSQVMNADCWLPDEGIEALIGRDILDRCFFQYMGLDRRFTLAF
jgi:hypothetical protein